MTHVEVRMPAPADRTAPYGAVRLESPRTAIVPPAAEDWVPVQVEVHRARKQTMAPFAAPIVPVLAGLETTHVGGPPPRLTPLDGRTTSPAVIPAAATYRPPAPRGESRIWLALSAIVFFLGLAAAGGVLAWILVQRFAS